MMARGPAKVVYINTQYVETDALSFKSVVQTLTGKDSVVPGPPPTTRRRQSPAAGQPTKSERSECYRPVVEAVQPEIRGGSSNIKLMGCRDSFLMRNLSFDRMTRELPLPPLDDIHSLFM